MKYRLSFLTISLYLNFFATASIAENVQSYADRFEEITQLVEKHFYNPDQISKEFPAISDIYRKQLTQVSTQEDFSILINRMLQELKASHTYYLTPNDYEYYQLGALFAEIPEIHKLFQGHEVQYPSVGIITQRINQHVYIASVLAGSIAAQAGLVKGDEILSVNGKPYTPVASLRSSLEKKAAFKIKRKQQGKPFTVMMKPIMVNPKQEMLEAQKASAKIFMQDGKRIGYVHLCSYAGNEYHEELLNTLIWGPLKEADALIIDLRYGLGGAWPYYLNLFNPNIPVLEIQYRDGKKNTVDSQWRKPAVYLVNRFSRSGKELLAFGAKKYHLATIIGERTAGQTLGGRLFPLSNKDLLFLAVQSSRIDGVDLEKNGVIPDIEVPFDIRYCSGQDIQIDKAVDFLTNQLKNVSKK